VLNRISFHILFTSIARDLTTSGISINQDTFEIDWLSRNAIYAVTYLAD